MKLYRITLNIAVSDELERISDSEFSVKNIESEILAKSFLWFQKSTGVKDLDGYLAMDTSFDDKEV